MKTIKLNTFRHSLFLLTLLVASACMPDSLTKLKQDPPKKDPPPVIKPGVVVGDDGSEVLVEEIIPTTKFYYGSEGSTYEGIYVINEEFPTLTPFIDGTLSDETLGKTLFVRCEVITSNDGLNRFPSGITFVDGDSKYSTKSCAVNIKPTNTASYNNIAGKAYEPVTYTVRMTFRNAASQLVTLDNQVKMAVLRRPTALTVSQTEKLVLDLTGVNDFARFDMNPKIATNKNSVATIRFKDSSNKKLIVSRDNNTQVNINDNIDNANIFYNTEATISNILNVVVVNERLESTYPSYPASCPTAPGPTSKLYIKNPTPDVLASNMITYSISPDLPATAKLCNYADTLTIDTDAVTPGNQYDPCYCRQPGEVVGYFDAVTNQTDYVVRAFNPIATEPNFVESTFRLVVSESPEGFNVAQRQLLRVTNRVDFEMGEAISEQVAPPLSAETAAKGRVLESFSYDSDADGNDEEYIDVELLRGRFRKDSSIDNARFFYAQNTIVLDNPFDYNVALKVNDAANFSANQYITGFLHNSSRLRGTWTQGGGFSPVEACTSAGTDIGKYWEVKADGTYAGVSVKVKDRLVCNGESIIREPFNSFTKGVLKFVNETTDKVYIASSYESYSDFRHPNVTTPFEQYQTIYEGLGLGSWNPSMSYYLGSWDATTLPTAASCTANKIRSYYVVSVPGNGYSIGDRITCSTIGGAWTKKTMSDLTDSPDSQVSCTPSDKFYKVSRAVSSGGTIATTGQMAALPACDETIHGQHRRVTTGMTTTLSGETKTFAVNDLVMCTFENYWKHIPATHPLHSFVVTQSSNTLAVGDVAYCDSTSLQWKKIASASSPYQHTYSTEVHSKSQVIKMASAYNTYYGRDLTSSAASAYIVHTSKTDASISDTSYLRVKDVKGFFTVTGDAVAHNEYRNQNDASYAAAGVVYPTDFLSSITAIDRVFDDNTFYLERGEFTILYPTTIRGGEVIYSISPALPQGLAFNVNTGEISGTPTIASAIREYTVTIQNAISSITYKFKLEVVDYFKVTEVNPNIFTAYMHKTGQNQHFRECKINSRDINSPNSTVGGIKDITPLDVTCNLEIGENDLTLYGLKFAHSVGGGVCNFVSYQPMAYWSYRPFNTSNATTNVLNRITVKMAGECVPGTYTVPGTGISASTLIGAEARPSNEICHADYSDITGGYNCDEGEYDEINVEYLDADGSVTNEACTTIVTNVKRKCGGQNASCIRGPVRDLLDDTAIEDGTVGKFFTASNGIDNKGEPYEVKALIRDVTNANFMLDNACTVNNYIYQNGRWGKTFDPNASGALPRNYGRAVANSAPRILSFPGASVGAPPSTVVNAEPTCDAVAEIGTVISVDAGIAGTNDDDIYLCVTDTTNLPTGALGFKYINAGKRWDVVNNVGPGSAFWSWNNGGYNQSNPYYVFQCEDSAREIKARIRVAVRDWDLEITPRDIGGGVYPLRLIDRVNPPNNVMDNPNTGEFGTNLNNYYDLDDIVTAPSAACGRNDPVPLLND